MQIARVAGVPMHIDSLVSGLVEFDWIGLRHLTQIRMAPRAAAKVGTYVVGSRESGPRDGPATTSKCDGLGDDDLLVQLPGLEPAFQPLHSVVVLELFGVEK